MFKHNWRNECRSVGCGVLMCVQLCLCHCLLYISRVNVFRSLCLIVSVYYYRFSVSFAERAENSWARLLLMSIRKAIQINLNDTKNHLQVTPDKIDKTNYRFSEKYSLTYLNSIRCGLLFVQLLFFLLFFQWIYLLLALAIRYILWQIFFCYFFLHRLMAFHILFSIRFSCLLAAR